MIGRLKLAVGTVFSVFHIPCLFYSLLFGYRYLNSDFKLAPKLPFLGHYLSTEWMTGLVGSPLTQTPGGEVARWLNTIAKGISGKVQSLWSVSKGFLWIYFTYPQFGGLHMSLWQYRASSCHLGKDIHFSCPVSPFAHLFHLPAPCDY